MTARPVACTLRPMSTQDHTPHLSPWDSLQEAPKPGQWLQLTNGTGQEDRPVPPAYGRVMTSTPQTPDAWVAVEVHPLLQLPYPYTGSPTYSPPYLIHIDRLTGRQRDRQPGTPLHDAVALYTGPLPVWEPSLPPPFQRGGIADTIPLPRPYPPYFFYSDSPLLLARYHRHGHIVGNMTDSPPRIRRKRNSFPYLQAVVVDAEGLRVVPPREVPDGYIQTDLYRVYSPAPDQVVDTPVHDSLQEAVQALQEAVQDAAPTYTPVDPPDAPIRLYGLDTGQGTDWKVYRVAVQRSLSPDQLERIQKILNE